ncbi:MAG: hypothetical protein ACPGQL_08350 [Thermoplasmatota archaeon]
MHPGRRRLLLAGLLLASLLAAVPSASAGLTPTTDYDRTYRFSDGFGGGLFVVSGELDLELRDGGGGQVYRQADDMEVRDLVRVTWQEPGRSPREEVSTSGDLRLRVREGGNVAMDLPGDATTTVRSPHALSLFSDLSDESAQQVGTVRLRQAVAASLLDGEVDLRPAGIVQGGTLIVMEETRVDILDGGRLVTSVMAEDSIITFDGRPDIPTFTPRDVILPFRDGARADFSTASDAAAQEALAPERLGHVLEDLAGAQGAAVEGLETFGDFMGDALPGMLDAAIIGAPAEPGSTQTDGELVIVRFDELTATRDAGVRMQGDAKLAVEGQSVDGGPALYGFFWFQFPWWSYLLWAAAIGLFIWRLVAKPEKEHETWDRYRWIGWVSSLLVGVGLFIWWDFEVRGLWGTSLLSGDTSDPLALLLVAVIQMAPFSLAGAAVLVPLRILGRSIFRLTGQGTFMGIDRAIAALLAFIPMVLLYRPYLELILTLTDGLLAT